MSTELYYTAPSDAIFEDIKRNAIKIWQGYDDTYGYATEKIDNIKDLANVSDNYMYMVAMFDRENQLKLISMLQPESVERINQATGEQYANYR